MLSFQAGWLADRLGWQRVFTFMVRLTASVVSPPATLLCPPSSVIPHLSSVPFGWIAVAGGLLSILLAHTVRMNDTGAVSPLAPATKAT